MAVHAAESFGGARLVALGGALPRAGPATWLRGKNCWKMGDQHVLLVWTIVCTMQVVLIS